MILEAQELQDLVCRVEENKKVGFLQLAEAVALVTTDEFMRVYISHSNPALTVNLPVTQSTTSELDVKAENEATAKEFMWLSSFINK